MKKTMKSLALALLVLSLLCTSATVLAENEIEECTITVLHFTGEESGRRGLENVTKAFNEIYPQIHVNIEFMPYGDHVQTLTLRMAAEDYPDVYECAQTTMISFIEAGEAEDQTGWDWTTQVDPGFLEQFMVDGKVYSSGCLYSGNAVIYNKTVFDRYGLTKPETYDELIAVCKTLKENGVEPFTASFAQQNGPANIAGVFYFPALYVRQSDELPKLISKEIKWTEAEVFKEAFRAYSGVLEYIDPSNFGTDLTTAYTRIGIGEAAMMVVGPFGSVDIMAAGPENEFGCFIMPWSNNPDENYMRVAGGDAWLVSSKTPHPEAAKAWLNFWQGAEGQTIYANTTGTALSFVKGFKLETENQVMLDNIGFIEAGKAITSDEVGGQFIGEYQQMFITLVQGWAALSPEERVDFDTCFAQFDAEWATIID